ncbi:MAG TPA: hypothetical protein PK858_12945, partial [Saprospiraceae bacterium]|nr:hypothetical protein [Saprospiraceae bacterium]
MRKKHHFLLIALLLGLWGHSALFAQTALVCNDFTYVSLDENCSAVVPSQMVLEGGPYCCYNDYIVELDKIAPFG